MKYKNRLNVAPDLRIQPSNINPTCEETKENHFWHWKLQIYSISFFDIYLLLSTLICYLAS
jgi:hypothetical protein